MKLPEISPIIFSDNIKHDPQPTPPLVRNVTPKIENKQDFKPRFPLLDIPDPKREYWDIEELEKFFSIADLPSAPVKLNVCSTIIDVKGFLESHFETVKFNNGKPTFRPYYNRLLEFKKLITNEN